MLATLQRRPHDIHSPRQPIFGTSRPALLGAGVHARIVLEPRTINPCQAPTVLRRVEITNRDDWLPRWQRNSVIRHSAKTAEDEYRRQECQQWISREHYLTVVIEWAIIHYRHVLKRHNHLSPDTFRRWAAANTAYADRRSGKGVVVRPLTVASLAHMDERRVKFCLAAAREIGLLVRLIKGDKLSWPDRCKARAAGSRQTGLSTVAAFVLPADFVKTLKPDTPPRGQLVPKSVSVRSNTSNRSAKASQTAQAPAPTRKSPRRWTKPAGYRLAVEAIQAIPWLTTGPGGLSPGRIATQLTRFATAPHPWTIQQLLNAMTAINRRLGHSAPDRAHHPCSMLAWFLRQIDPIADHPAYIQDLERDNARRRAGAERTARLRARVDADVERAQAASGDVVGVAAAQIRAELVRRRG